MQKNDAFLAKTARNISSHAYLSNKVQVFNANTMHNQYVINIFKPELHALSGDKQEFSTKPRLIYFLN